MPRAAPIVSRAAGSRVVVLGLAICLLGAGYEFSLNLPTSPEPHRSDSAGSRKSSQDLDAVQVDDFTLVLPSDGTERVLFVESDQSSRGGVPRVEVDDSVQPEVLQRCYTDPSLYAKHFNKAGQHMGEGFCAKSERHKLMYFHIPKAGSSTSRHAMLDLFDAHDNAHCRPQDNDWAECQKVSIVREPTSRFYAGYDEWFARRLSHKHTIPEEVREVSEGIPEYKAYEKLFLSPELTRRFEAFVNKWDARNAFDDHIRMQTPTLSNWRNGIAYPMNYLGTVSNMNESWSDIGQLVGRPVQASEVQRGRSFPRRFNTSAVADVVRRRICQILALDYCCLNFPLPEVCAHESLEPEDRVMCKWVHRPEVAVHHLNMNSSWFIEPVHHKLSPSL